MVTMETAVISFPFLEDVRALAWKAFGRGGLHFVLGWLRGDRRLATRDFFFDEGDL